MFLCLWVLAIVIGYPLAGFAQFVDNSEFVEVAKGTKLFPNAILEKSKDTFDQENVYWRVSSKVRANGTQTVTPFVREALYDHMRGDTMITERRYEEEYATFFKRSAEHKEMFLMINPKDGRVEATGEILFEEKMARASVFDNRWPAA